MRHRRIRHRLGYKPPLARMMERNLITSLLLYEAIRTTKRRADVIRPRVDVLVRIAKTRPPHVAVRSINRLVTDKNACRKIMEVYVQRYASRTSGFTVARPVGVRKGDGAELVDVVLVDADLGASPVPEKKEKAKAELQKASKKKVAKKSK